MNNKKLNPTPKDVADAINCAAALIACRKNAEETAEIVVINEQLERWGFRCVSKKELGELKLANNLNSEEDLL